MMTAPWPLPRLIAGFVASLLAPALGFAQDAPRGCYAPPALMRLRQPLPRLGQRLAKHQPITIVAIGSSSTFGAGASSAAASYPSRLAVELKARFPNDSISVINRGVNGEEARDMLARFSDGVVKVKPDLVLWQVGTNSVLRDHPLEIMTTLILDGVRQLRTIGADIVMIDPQYTPRYIAKPEAEQMVGLIAATAKAVDVDLIDRFEVMRYWHDAEHMNFSEFSSPDQLHMNDWSYACLAKLIAGSVAEAATRTVASAQVALPGHTTTH